MRVYITGRWYQSIKHKSIVCIIEIANILLREKRYKIPYLLFTIKSKCGYRGQFEQLLKDLFSHIYNKTYESWYEKYLDYACHPYVRVVHLCDKDAFLQLMYKCDKTFLEKSLRF